jgi:uncharacterized protein YndB with AHSA1/START domain
MEDTLTANANITIHAPVSRVWQALTDPVLIKLYLFGTDTISDWKKGSSITWSGVYEGKSYRDKGTIIDIVPEKLLHTTHYSPLSGKEDKAENYHHVVYRLKQENENTVVTITQDNVRNDQELRQMEKNWKMVLEEMKKLLEK